MIVHAISSLLISVIMYFANLPVESCVLCLLTGVFVDIDHFIDYLLWSKDKTLKKFWILGPSHYTEIHLTDTLLHSIDLFSLLVIPFILYWPIAAIGIMTGFFSHLALDQIGFRYNPLHFFLLYRIFVEKKKERTLRDTVLKRDGFKCRDCGAMDNLQLHRNLQLLHRTSWNTIEEWTVVCEKCHMKRHGSGMFY